MNSHTETASLGDPCAMNGGIAESADSDVLKFFEALFESSLDAVVILDDAGRFVDANPAACQLTGRTKSALVGHCVTETVEMHSHFATAWTKFVHEGTYRGKRWLVRPDGGRRLIEIIATANVLPGKHLAIWRDATDRYVLESELVQAEKQEALARFARGMAHDLTNQLNIIAGHAELMIREIGSNCAVQQRGHRILTATKKASRLTVQLSVFGRQQVLVPSVLDLGAFVRSAGNTVRSLVPHNIDLVLPDANELLPVCVDRTQMAQIVFTLASIGSETITRGGCLTIRVRNVSLNHSHDVLFYEIPPGEYVALDVHARAGKTTLEGKTQADRSLPESNNPMPSAYLPAVYGTVKQNGGFLTVSEAIDGGTTRSVYFPRVAVNAVSSERNESHSKVREEGRRFS